MSNGPVGQGNRQLAQFLAPAMLVRLNGDEPDSGPSVDVSAGDSLTIGFTSGVPENLVPAAASPVSSGLSLPAKGTYEVHAIVYVSGLANNAGHANQAVPPKYSIALSLDDTDVPQSVSTVVANSGLFDGNVGRNQVELTRLETKCIIETSQAQTLRLRVQGNDAAGPWRLVGADSMRPAQFTPIATPAAVVTVARLPNIPFNARNVHLSDG